MSDQPSLTDNAPTSPPQIRKLTVGLTGGAKTFLFLLMLIFAVLTAAINYWGYLGYPSPATFAYWSTAQTDCLNLAKEHQSDLSSEGNASIKVENEWMRKGKIVVELAMRKSDADTSFSSRLCVVGDGQTEIVPGLSQAAWE